GLDQSKELIARVAATGQDCIDVEEVPRERATVERCHLVADGVVWVQDGSDAQCHRWMGTPVGCKLNLLRFHVRFVGPGDQQPGEGVRTGVYVDHESVVSQSLYDEISRGRE